MKYTIEQLKRKRIRARITGSAVRPRLSVHVSNRQIIAQLVDDASGKTLGYVTSQSEQSLQKETMTKKAQWVGEHIAAAAKSSKIDTVVFDRGTHIYHGRIKALAQVAREKGLKF